jgi:hypothetical protein
VSSVPQTHPPLRGAKRWRNWCDEPPYLSHTLVEAWRREWPEAEIIDIRRMHPAMNVADLYWCPLSEPVLEPETRKAGK